MDLTPQELKKALASAGFEVYRISGGEVILADRVRENLILDSGVRVKASPFQVWLIMGIRRSQYPSDDDGTMFDRVRQLAAPLLSDGFTETGACVAPVLDPANSERTLDTFFEVVFSKDEGALEGALRTLPLALTVAKTAESRH